MAGAVLATAVVRVGGDRWGWATFAAYGPRVLVLVPIVPIGVVAGWRWFRRRRPFPWVSTAAVAIAAVGVLGLNVPWRALVSPSSTSGRTIRLLELNANGGGTDDEPYDKHRLADLVARTAPDVMVLAEWPDTDAPPARPSGGPWDVRRSGDVAVASRFPITRTAAWSGRPLGGEGTVLGCRLTVAGRPLWCFGLHLETPRRGFEPALHRQPGAGRLMAQSLARRRQLSALAAAFVRGTAGADDVLIAGDFNEVDDGAIFGDTWAGWPDAFGRAGWGFGWTKWQWGWGVRIDHVLTAGPWRPRRCWVGPDVGSDHRPLLADLVVARVSNP